MWTIAIDHTAGKFPAYASRQEAERVARRYRACWTRHRYAVVRERD